MKRRYLLRYAQTRTQICPVLNELQMSYAPAHAIYDQTHAIYAQTHGSYKSVFSCKLLYKQVLASITPAELKALYGMVYGLVNLEAELPQVP
jgi:hypothetical protein